MSHDTPYRGIPNRFKRNLSEGKLQIGCFSSLASPLSTEILGLAGFDWIMLDGEHAPNDLNGFILQLMALKDSVSAPVYPVGILAPEEADARRYIEMGATMVAVGSDQGLFRAATQNLRDRFAS